MRILQLVQTPQRRGAEIFAYQLSRELCAQGHTVRTVYLYPYTGAGGLAVQTGDVVLDGVEQHPFEKLPGVHPLLLRRLLRHLDEFRPDVVQVNGARTVKYGAFARRFRARRLGVGLSQHWQPPGLGAGWYRRLFYSRVVMPQLDGVIGASALTLRNLHAFYTLSIPTVHIPNGIDHLCRTPCHA